MKGNLLFDDIKNELFMSNITMNDQLLVTVDLLLERHFLVLLAIGWVGSTAGLDVVAKRISLPMPGIEQSQA